jgi:CheY-like chemotaxis protein
MGEAQRSAKLIRQLLAFARKQAILPEVLDLNEAVESMLTLLRRLIGEGVDVAWKPQSDLWPVELDLGQAEQMLADLCVNARDAMGGVGHLTIETGNVTVDAAYCAYQPEASPGAYVALAVSDDGCGMDAETLARIFEPFYTTKPVGEGTGLGLATVHGIVKQNGGFVNVHSRPGEGTTFRIHLPRSEGQAAEKPESGESTESVGGSETILLVEDEKSVRVTTGLLLEQLGYTVLTADAGSIDLLVTDVVMSGMSGRDLATELAAQRPGTKCLFISGYTAEVIAHRGILDAGVEFLGKPFSRDDIARKVRRVLDG